VTEAEIREWTERSRTNQGLPPKITDPGVLTRLVTLAFSGQEEQGEGDDTAP
jgi:hypothetical protein